MQLFGKKIVSDENLIRFYSFADFDSMPSEQQIYSIRLVLGDREDKEQYGWVELEIENGYGNIQELFVIEELRRRGYGRILMQEALLLCETANCVRAGLLVAHGAKNTIALSLFRSLGFNEQPKVGGESLYMVKHFTKFPSKFCATS